MIPSRYVLLAHVLAQTLKRLNWAGAYIYRCGNQYARPETPLFARQRAAGGSAIAAVGAHSKETLTHPTKEQLY